MNAPWLEVQHGDAPLIVAMPHTGTSIPEECAHDFTSEHIALKDTDWHIEKLYAFATDLGATVVRTPYSRSLIDANRDPSGASLYPGMTTTELCPTTTFDGEGLYKTGQAPDESEIARRRDAYHAPYHDALHREIARLRASHSHIVLYDAHSIRSRAPRLFEGELPCFNIGTFDGRACAEALAARVVRLCEESGLPTVLNGRFKGGYTTRAHGNPDAGVHAIQMELAMRAYLDEPETATETNWPPTFTPERAARARKILSEVLQSAIAFAHNASK